MEQDLLKKRDFPDPEGIDSAVRNLLGVKVINRIQESHELTDFRIYASMTIQKKRPQIPHHVLRSHLRAPLPCLHTILCFPTIVWTSSSILMVAIKVVPERCL